MEVSTLFMCGICGEVRFDGGSPSVSAVSKMADVLSPRGPDASGIVIRGNIGFGHRRLRILDLSEKSQQPMIDADLGLTLVFNGCIYNFRELRAELEQMGYKFFSDGDTEVILKAWHAWGESCVTRFLGMFAFAIHERDTGRIITARDRFGIKPLYIAEVAGALRFASSLPALVKAGGIDTSIDRAALHNYMSFHAVVPPPRTIYNGVRKLPRRRSVFTNRMGASLTVFIGRHPIGVCRGRRVEPRGMAGTIARYAARRCQAPDDFRRAGWCAFVWRGGFEPDRWSAC